LSPSLQNNPQHRRILSQFYDTYAACPWLIKAEFDGNQFDIHATEKPKQFESVETFLLIKKIYVVRWIIGKN